MAFTPEGYLAGDLLDWYREKLNEITSLVPVTLAFVAVFLAIVAYIVYRSWKKAVMAAIGGAIVIALVAKLADLAGLVESELDTGAPPPSAPVTRTEA